VGIRFSHGEAAEYFREQAHLAQAGDYDHVWLERFRQFNAIVSAPKVGKTHVAFLGTALLAKSLRPDTDVTQIKPKHSSSPRSFAARSLCHNSLVPVAIDLNIDLGVTGREPLNALTYLRMNVVDRTATVSTLSQPAFDFLLSIIDEVNLKVSVDEISAIFRAWIASRMRSEQQGRAIEISRFLSLSLFPDIDEFVRLYPESGKVAQAMAAGICDAVCGHESVVAGKVNDPSLRQVGDVGLVDHGGGQLRAIEVRTKVVTRSDCQHFIRSCADRGVKDCVMLAAAERQDPVSEKEIAEWAAHHGVSFQIVYGLNSFLASAALFAGTPQSFFLAEVARRCRIELDEIEASSEAQAAWERAVEDCG